MAATTHFGQASYSYANELSHMSDSPSNIPSLTPASTLGSNYDTSSPSHDHACDDVLEDTVFPELKNNEESDVQELQKEDPIGIDMWKFYRKQSNVPDAERMQNMTWRMMAINLRKVQRKRESSHAAVGRVRAPAAEHWSPTTARQQTTTVSQTNTHQRRIAIPRKGSVGKALWIAPPGDTRMDDVKFEDPSSTYQFDFTPPELSQNMPPPDRPMNFQTPSTYSLLNGPRGKIQVPDGFKQEPDAASGTHTRHVSLGGAGYSDSSSPFGIKSDFTNLQPTPGGSNVTPWDPGWAEEAFGGQSLYDTPPEIKKEEIDLFPENWIAHDAAQHGFGSQTSAVLNQHATAQSLSQWQQFEDSHFAELSGQKTQFGSQPGQYGQMFTTSGFGLGDSNINAQSSIEPQAGYWGHASSSETTGRKRRKGL
ncbi:Nitrogen regulatory protein area [Lasiodiplodia theobromae]|uniref:Nitrogen regulatory protein area n=1 Tax=Lasiodiplodia theobromae TaxID=45133 RepID=UPI0015C36128|nr:Nitrogen regulatory protein area [Lasiodiplodia theobromae]KAF4543017.1 Nitrogen regulatory protein area [Lasiodiplodia theobromae]